MSRAAFMVAAPRVAALRALNYSQEIEILDRGKHGRFRPAPLNSLLKEIGSSYGQVFTRLDCASEHGVQLIAQVDMFAAEPVGRTIRRDSMPHPAHHLVKKWQLLIAGAGQMGENNLFGRTIIADERLEGKFVGPDAVMLDFENPGSALNLWTYAFLNTTLGLRAIKACAYGTSIPHLRLDLLEELPIPIPEDADLLDRVATLLRRCVERRVVFLRELQSARRIVEALPIMIDAVNLCRERKAQIVSWNGPFPTMSAWTFASTGGALKLLSERCNRRLRDALSQEGLFNGPRFARVSCDAPHGIDFMSQRDPFLIRPFSRRIMHPDFDDRLLFVQENTILVASHGTLGEGEIFGRAAFAHGRFLKSGFTQDILRIVPNRESALTLFAFLTTTVGMRLLRSTAVGTKILSMRPDLLLDLPFPELSIAGAKSVEVHLTRSFAARDEADLCEQEAIRIVEEEVLAAWLE